MLSLFFEELLLQQPHKARQIAWSTKHVQKLYRILIGTLQVNSHLGNTNADGKFYIHVTVHRDRFPYNKTV
jgi:hypothetical protein